MNTNLYVLPLFAIIIHNTEEFVWLPNWSKYASKFNKNVKSYEFRFAVLIITILSVIFTTGIIAFPDNEIVKFMYFGFFGSMIINAIFPHLLLTVVLKKYAPGTVTALMLNVPINLLVLFFAIKNDVITFVQVVFSVLAVGVVTLLLLPLLYKLGDLVKDYQ